MAWKARTGIFDDKFAEETESSQADQRRGDRNLRKEAPEEEETKIGQLK